MAPLENALDQLNRRRFLAGTFAVAMSAPYGKNGLALAGDQVAGTSNAAFPGMILRERVPLNLEFPFPTLDNPITPNHQFFVRSHFAIPKLDRATWRLKVDGHVHKELDLSYDELQNLPSKTVTATIECAGNSRAFLSPKAKGVAWELGAIGNAKWSGVSLASVLEKAGIRDGAVEVILEGADKGEVNDDPKSPGPIHFVRSLPLEKANRPEVLLAHRMNDDELPNEHGFPLRAIVPGWYGMASVKWLTRITVSPIAFRGYWQSMSYTYWQRHLERPSLVPVTEMQVKSAIARPCLHEVIRSGSNYRVFGAAWAGESAVKKVELSTDGGQTWVDTKLIGESHSLAWQFWEYEWRIPNMAGPVRLMSKATDLRGRSQQTSHNSDYGGYMIHHTLPVDVEIR